MQFTIASIIALAASASAVLVARDLTCAEGSKISCCTTNSGSSGVLGNVAGGSCLLDQVSLLSALDNVCPSGNTFCCPVDQKGALNVQASCIPVNA